MRATLFLLVLPAFAAVTVQVNGTTAMQASISILGATYGSSCLVRVYDQKTGNLVNDVNESLFTGSGHTARAGTVNPGTANMTFIVGTRGEAQQGTDTGWYSRALGAGRTYNGDVNSDAACGSGTATFTFTTQTIAMGRLWNESLAIHTQQIVGRGTVFDSQTGAVITGVQSPGDAVNSSATAAAYSSPVPDAGGTWSCGVLPCTYNSTNQAKLFLPINANSGQLQPTYTDLSHGFLAAVTNHITLSVASGTVVINGCLTNNGVTCASGTVQHTATTTPTTYTYGGAQYNWADWGANATLPFDHVKVTQKTGTVTNAAGVLTLSGGSHFVPPYAANTPITLTGAGCSAGFKRMSGAQSDSDLQITLTADPGCSGSTTYTLTPFGLLLWSNTASMVNITVGASGTNYDYEIDYEAQLDSSAMQLSSIQSGGPAITLSGCDHYMAYQTGGSSWYLIAPSGCDTPRYLGQWINPAVSMVNPGGYSIPTGSATFGGAAVFDPSNVGVITSVEPAFNGDAVLIKVKYWPNTTWTSQAANTVTTICNGNNPPTNQPCIQITSLETSLITKLRSYSAEFAADCCGIPPVVSGGCPDGTIMMQVAYAGQQGVVGMAAVYDPAMTNFVAARKTTDWYPNTSNGFHSVMPRCVISGGKRIIGLGQQLGGVASEISDGLTVPGSTPGAGPYRLRVSAGISNATSACPGSPPGGSPIAAQDWPGGSKNAGTQCTTVTATSNYWEDPSPYRFNITATVANGAAAFSVTGNPLLKTMIGKPVFLNGVQYTIATITDSADGTISPVFSGSACATSCAGVVHAEPSCSDISLTCDTSTDFALRVFRPGDKLFVGTPTAGASGYNSYANSQSEAMMVLTVTGGNTLLLQRNYGGALTVGNWAGPTYLYSDSGNFDYFCNCGISQDWDLFWNTTDNPDGSLVASFPDVIQYNPNSGHGWFGIGANVGNQTIPPVPAGFAVPLFSGGTIGTAYQSLAGVNLSFVSATPSFQPLSASFNGQPTGVGTPNNVDLHPSQPYLSGQNFILDGRVFSGGTLCGGTTPGTRVGGSLFKFTFSQCNFPSAAALILSHKIIPWLKVAGHYGMTDISGPGSVLGQTTSDNYKVCVVNVVNECVSGSALGDVYFNAPGISSVASAYPGISDGGDTIQPEIGPAGPWVHRAVQMDFGAGTNYSGGTTRALWGACGPYRWFSPFCNVRSDPTGTTMLSQYIGANANQSTFVMTALPPIVYDSVNGADFVPVQVPINAVTGAVSAAVEFGYAENGAAGSYYCTGRQEACIKGSTAGFAYETTDTWVPASFVSGAVTITVPALSQRVLYYRVKYYSAGPTLIFTGPQQSAMVP